MQISDFNHCIYSLTEELPRTNGYIKYREELRRVSPTEEGKWRLIAIINSLPLEQFNKLEEVSKGLNWPPAFKQVFSAKTLSSYFDSDAMYPDVAWIASNFLSQHKNNRVIEFATSLRSEHLRNTAISEIIEHMFSIGGWKLSIGIAHLLTGPTKNVMLFNLRRMIFSVSSGKTDLIQQFSSADDRSKMCFLISVSYYQGARFSRALQYARQMPEQTMEQANRKKELIEFLEYKHPWDGWMDLTKLPLLMIKRFTYDIRDF